MSRQSGSALMGIVLLFVGIMFLASNLGWMDVFSWLRWGWAIPLALIVGWAWMVRRIPSLMALFLLSVAALFIADGLGFIGVNVWGIVWPLAIIWFGLQIFFRWDDSSHGSDQSLVDLFALFSGIERVITSKAFSVARITSLFGGVKLDLRDAKIVDEGATIDLLVAFGGVEILVPQDTNVDQGAFAAFGGIEDKSKGVESKGKILRLRGTILFGGVEIKE